MPELCQPDFAALLPELRSTLSRSFNGVKCELKPCPNVEQSPFNLPASSLGQVLYIVPESIHADEAIKQITNGKVLATTNGFHVVSDGKTRTILCISLEHSGQLITQKQWVKPICNCIEKSLVGLQNWEMLCVEIRENFPGSNPRICLLRKSLESEQEDLKQPNGQVISGKVRTTIWLVPINRRIVAGCTKKVKKKMVKKPKSAPRTPTEGTPPTSVMDEIPIATEIFSNKIDSNNLNGLAKPSAVEKTATTVGERILANGSVTTGVAVKLADLEASKVACNHIEVGKNKQENQCNGSLSHGRDSAVKEPMKMIEEEVKKEEEIKDLLKLGRGIYVEDDAYGKINNAKHGNEQTEAISYVKQNGGISNGPSSIVEEMKRKLSGGSDSLDLAESPPSPTSRILQRVNGDLRGVVGKIAANFNGSQKQDQQMSSPIEAGKKFGVMLKRTSSEERPLTVGGSHGETAIENSESEAYRAERNDRDLPEMPAVAPKVTPKASASPASSPSSDPKQPETSNEVSDDENASFHTANNSSSRGTPTQLHNEKASIPQIDKPSSSLYLTNNGHAITTTALLNSLRRNVGANGCGLSPRLLNGNHQLNILSPISSCGSVADAVENGDDDDGFDDATSRRHMGDDTDEDDETMCDGAMSLRQQSADRDLLYDDRSEAALDFSLRDDISCYSNTSTAVSERERTMLASSRPFLEASSRQLRNTNNLSPSTSATPTLMMTRFTRRKDSPPKENNGTKISDIANSLRPSQQNFKEISPPKTHHVRGMPQMPVAVLQHVLNQFSYKEMADLRRVHPHWDELCGQLLNTGYYQLINTADQLLTECQRRVHADKFLQGPIQVLTNLHVYVLNPVDSLRAVIDEGVLCFPYGLILDKAFEVLRMVENMIKTREEEPDVIYHCEKLALLSRRAQVHYRQFVEPEAEKRMGEVYKLSAVQRLQRLDSFLVEANVTKLEREAEKAREDLKWEIDQLKGQNQQLKKDNRELKTNCLKLDQRVEVLERKFKTIARLLQ